MSDPRDEALQKVKDQLRQNQDEIAKRQHEIAQIQNKIKLLENHQAELKKATDGYGKAAAVMKQELEDDNALIERKLQMAAAAIPDTKVPVDDKIKEFNGNLDVDEPKKVDDANKAATRAAADNDAAVEDLRTKQKDYKDLQDKPKTLDTQLKELKGVIDLANRAEAQRDFLAMYFYLCVAKKQAGDIEILSPDEYEKHLLTQQDAIATAADAASKKKDESDQAATVAENARKTHDAAAASRRADLLAALREVKPPRSPRSGGTSSARGGTTTSLDADADHPAG